MPSVKSGFQICVMFLLCRRSCRLTYPIIALLLADVFPMPLAYPRSRLHPHSHSHSRFHIGVAGISKIFLLALAPYILYPISSFLFPVSYRTIFHFPVWLSGRSMRTFSQKFLIKGTSCMLGSDCSKSS